MSASVAEIERAIQLAIAPAFLLTGIIAIVNVLAGRLGRLIDRERAIRAGTSTALPGERPRLAQRARHAHRAITGCVVAALLLCAQIVASFIGIFLGLQVAWLLGLLLIGAMVAVMIALLLFLQEVRLASQHLPMATDG